MASVLVRSLTAKQTETITGGPGLDELFADSGAISKWAVTDVLAGARLGLVQGKEANAFMPQAEATRAEAVTIIGRWLALQ
ncbi:hypothetical protein D3C71_2047480 [compost metagenome]